MSALAKRFSPLAEYRRTEEAGYRLLPFRFTPLNSTRYVLSNLAGEYIVLHRDQVSALAEHRLPPGDLYDLAPKNRTLV